VLQYVSQARASGFVSGAGIQRYTISHQTPTTLVTGQTSWVATTPTFMIYKTATQISNRLILSNFTLEQDGTVAGAKIGIIGAIDTTNRYASGGTAVVPQLTSAQQVASAVTPEFTFRTNPTATAAGSFNTIPRYFNLGSWLPVTGTTLPTCDCQDEFVIQGPGSILIYTFATGTGPSWNFTFEVIEEPVQGIL